MSDLISRQAAIDAILHNQEVYSNNFGNDPIDRYTVAIIDNDAQTIAQLPTIEAEPIKHGRWREYNYPGQECVYCSACKTEYYPDDLIVIGVNDYPYYCPNCGARMDLEGGRNRT